MIRRPLSLIEFTPEEEENIRKAVIEYTKQRNEKKKTLSCAASPTNTNTDSATPDEDDNMELE
jgi:hypothetical protein